MLQVSFVPISAAASSDQQPASTSGQGQAASPSKKRKWDGTEGSDDGQDDHRDRQSRGYTEGREAPGDGGKCRSTDGRGPRERDGHGGMNKHESRERERSSKHGRHHSESSDRSADQADRHSNEKQNAGNAEADGRYRHPSAFVSLAHSANPHLQVLVFLGFQFDHVLSLHLPLLQDSQTQGSVCRINIHHSFES